MRTELKYIEQIEQYLEGKLAGEALQQFEAELAVNPAFRNEVALQGQLIKRLNYLSAKEDLNLIHHKLYPTKPAWTSLLSKNYTFLASVSILFVMGLWFLLKTNSLEEQTLPLQANAPNPSLGNSEIENSIFSESLEDINETQPDADFARSPAKKPFRFTASKVVDILYPNREQKDKQVFVIQTDKDTTIVGKKGTKVFIPSRVFVRQNGAEVANATVKVALIELYDLGDYIKYDLPTISNGKMLESGGVVYLDATENGEKLAIAKGKAVSIEFNSPHARRDRMQAFYLQRNEEGKPNWITEKPDKITEIITARFVNNKKSKNKQKGRNSIDFSTTSIEDQKNVYYIFPKHTPKQLIAVEQSVLRYDLFYKGIVFKDEPKKFEELAKVLMDKRYANTYIATVPFRERLEGIFLEPNTRIVNGESKTESELLLEIYTENIDKPLWVADSLAAIQIAEWAGKCEQYKSLRATLFRWLASQHYTSVIVPEKEDRKLKGNHHYNKYVLAEEFSKKYQVDIQEWLKSYEFLKYRNSFRRYYKNYYKGYNDNTRARLSKDYTYLSVLQGISKVGHWGFDYATFYKDRTNPIRMEVKSECMEIQERYNKAIANNLINQDASQNNSLLVTRLGWINCDRFFALPPNARGELLISLQIADESVYQPALYLVFKKQNAVVPIYRGSLNQFSLNYLPLGEEAEVVALWHNGEKIFYQKENFTIAKKKQVSLTLRKADSQQEVKEMIAGIR
jgi:hypothetical protein